MLASEPLLAVADTCSAHIPKLSQGKQQFSPRFFPPSELLKYWRDAKEWMSSPFFREVLRSVPYQYKNKSRLRNDLAALLQ